MKLAQEINSRIPLGTTPTVIVVAEPICRGGEHAVLNAGLLATVRIAYPQAKVWFLADQGHLDAVRAVLRAELVDGVQVLAVTLPPKALQGVGRIGPMFRLCKRILGTVADSSSTLAIFSAVDEVSLLSIEVLLRFVFRRMRVLSIPHSVLQRIRSRPPRLPWNRLLWFRTVLKCCRCRRMTIVVPGESIRQATAAELPGLGRRLCGLELAYFFHDADTAAKPNDKVIRFGFLGVGTRRKGIDIFCQLATRVLDRPAGGGGRTEFHVVGPIEDSIVRSALDARIHAPSPDQFVPADQVAAHTKLLTYAVFPYRPEQYTFVASAAFLDAMLSVKPIIALSNPYFEYYERRMGKIGYLCQDAAEMEERICGIAATFPEQDYLAQCQNIEAGRTIFTPNALAPTLRNIVEGTTVK